ncbi:MAG: carboxypeptidase-like regulatory domain-containing protein [bacterium]|nr:carboxypeptidase-like regulatory domain-containing protein [bacterium]
MHQRIKVIACWACTLMLGTAVLGTATLRAQELDPPIPAIPDVPSEAAPIAAEAVPTPSQSILEAVTAYQSGWGSLRQDGSLHGQVLSPAGVQAGATVTIQSGGATVGSATSDEQGRFVITGLSPGLHTLRADSGSSYAVHSVLLQQGGADSVMNVYCAGLPRSEIERMFSEMWSPGNWFDTPESSTARLLGPPAPQMQNPRVNMRGGVVNGQLLFPSPNWLPSGHMVKVFRNGQLLATAPADQYGRFSFEPGTAGAVDIVAGGGAY